MSIDHRRFDILVAEKLLDRSDVIATPEQVSGEGMAEGVTCGPFRQACLYDRVSHSFLHQGFVNVMASLFMSLAIGPAILLR